MEKLKILVTTRAAFLCNWQMYFDGLLVWLQTHLGQWY